MTTFNRFRSVKGLKIQHARSAETQDYLDASHLSKQPIREYQNIQDADLVKTLLAHPHTWEDIKPSWQKLLEWLTGKSPCGARVLSNERRTRLEKALSKLNLIQAGKIEKSNFNPSQRRPLCVPRPKPQLAEFLNDPSLLPKRPPPRRQEENE